MSSPTPIFTKVVNGRAISLAEISDLSWIEFESVILAAISKELRVVALFGASTAPDATLLYAVLADDRRGFGLADEEGPAPGDRLRRHYSLPFLA